MLLISLYYLLHLIILIGKFIWTPTLQFGF